MPWRILTAAIAREQDVVAIRQRARHIAELLGFDTQDQTRIATAVSEIARNAFGYGGGGKAEFSIDNGAVPQGFEVRISDQGPGIADLDLIMDGLYRSPTGMGIGIMGARRLMDRFSVDTAPGAGTRVTLAKTLPRNAVPVTRERLAEITRSLTEVGTFDPLAVMREQNRELLSSLDALRSRQDEMHRLNEELEDTNRGVVALYAELEDKAEQLRQASELKSRFLSNMSHEFRTPLNSIMALARLLLDRTDGDLTGEQEKQITLIRKSATQLTEMVNDLLDIAKVEAGKLDVHAVSFTVEELFGGLRGVLKPLQTSGAVDLLFEEPEGLPPLRTDEGKVAQILRNFISNALKFTEQGEVRVSARLDAGRIVFAVTDTGLGIAPEHHDRIFEEFAQVPNPLQRKVKGTGLGLPLSKKLAELLGGSVAVESTPGKGSTFTLTIPAAYGAADGADGGAGLRVLVIDDEETFRYLFGHLIGGLGHEVREAGDGETGIRLARDLCPDLIFLDVQMPGIDGYETLRRLKADAGTSRIPVVVVTSSVIGPREEALLGAAAAILPKSMISRDTVSGVLQSVTPSHERGR